MRYGVSMPPQASALPLPAPARDPRVGTLRALGLVGSFLGSLCGLMTSCSSPAESAGSPPQLGRSVPQGAWLPARAAEDIQLHRRGFGPIDPDRPRVLIVVAHPDDELVSSGAIYAHGARHGGAVDVLTITDGQGGFKYASFAEALHGVELTREEIGRRELPDIRREEQRRALELLGARMLARLGQPDHRYSQDRMEVLDEAAGVWDLSAVRAHLDRRLNEGAYDFVITLPPTRTTHGHHQAATVLALEAVARIPEARRPVAMCCQVEGHIGGGVGEAPDLIDGEPLVKLRAGVGPWSLDRNRPFGHRDRLTLKSMASVAVAQHLSQGTMLSYIGTGDIEEYWMFDVSPVGAAARAERWFTSLEDLGLPERSYDTSAGTNATQ